jgi:4-hydroxybenzoate polyprenyltransferase
MDQARTDRLTFAVALRLGRVSNVPTVWTNVAAGVALSSAAFPLGIFAGIVVALSLFYIGGMYLNDAFDRRWDAQHRPERPIPAGHIRPWVVFTAGAVMMAVGIFLVAVLKVKYLVPSWRPTYVAIALARIPIRFR